MLIIVNRQEFLKKMRIVQKAINENKIKPIISCVYIETRGKELFFCGTNLETTINTTMHCEEVKEQGKLAFQYQLIDEYLKEIKDEFVTIRVDKNILFIDSIDSTSEFSIMDANDFPNIFEKINFEELEVKLKIESLELATIFEKIKFSSAGSENISVNCVRIENQEDGLNFVTTDTYRLTYLNKKFEEKIGEISVSIPLETVEAVTKILRSIDSEEVKIFLLDNHVYFKIDTILIVSRVIDLAFPKYSSILENSKYNKKLIINVEEFLNVLKRVIIFVRNNSESKYGATFNLSDSTMTINGVSDIAKINEEIFVNFNGENIKISLNIKFLFDFVQNINKASDLVLELQESNSSVRVTEYDNEDYVYMLMPLALKN